MNINDFLSAMQHVPTDDLIRMASDLTNKLDLSVLATVEPPRLPYCYPTKGDMLG